MARPKSAGPPRVPEKMNDRMMELAALNWARCDQRWRRLAPEGPGRGGLLRMAVVRAMQAEMTMEEHRAVGETWRRLRSEMGTANELCMPYYMVKMELRAQRKAEEAGAEGGTGAFLARLERTLETGSRLLERRMKTLERAPHKVSAEEVSGIMKACRDNIAAVHELDRGTEKPVTVVTRMSFDEEGEVPEKVQ